MTTSTLKSYIYSSTKQDNPTKRIFGTLKARHSFEALHNARFLAQERNASVRFITLIPLN